MGSRGRSRAARGVLALLALAAFVAGCGRPAGVTVTELALNAPRFDGRQVEVSGIVRELGGDDLPRYYVLQDAEVNRVQLLPDEEAEPHVGSAVRVVGEFSFDDQTGRKLRIETIESVRPSR